MNRYFASARRILSRVGRTAFFVVRTRPLVWQASLVLLLAILINWTVLTQFNSYISFGNFLLPFTESQYREIPTPPWVWSPFQYNGVPVVVPFPGIVGYATSALPLALAAGAFGPVVAAKLYIVGSIFLLGLSFVLFSRSLIRDPKSQALGASFLLLGPFQLAMYGQGYYEAFVSEACVFFGLYALWRAIENPNRRWVLFPLSFWLLVLSISFFQVFILGTVLYVVLGFAYAYRASRRSGSWRGLLSTIARYAMLPLLIAPVLASTISGPVTLAPTSTYAFPLSTFLSYSASPLRLMLLQGYFNLNYQYLAAVGIWIANFWTIVADALLISIWLGYLVVHDRRLLLLFAIALGASLLGAGGQGPLGPFNIYLYLHAPGYQAVNASFFWDWMLVFPAYALGFGVLFECLVEKAHTPSRSVPAPPNPDRARRWRKYLGGVRDERYRKAFAVGLVTLFVVAAVVPYGLQVQYDTSQGVHEAAYPSDYAILPSLLQSLVGNNYSGVALFNPDVNWFLPNSSQVVPNAFFLFPTVRTPGLPFYASLPTQSNQYFYWVYQQFYDNLTRYAGELFSVVGVEYFLVFYGTQSASFYPYFLPSSDGKNASELMQYQLGVVPVYESKDFAIYRNLFYGSVSAALKSVSFVAGDYGELNALAYSGVNLTNQAFVFTTDLSPQTCRAELPLVSRVYAENLNSLLSLGLECNSVATFDPLDYAAASLTATQGWTSSIRTLGIPVTGAWPEETAVTQGGSHTLQVPVSVSDCGTACSVWMPVRFYADGGILDFTWGSQSYTVNTSRGFDGVNNSMAWVNLPFSITIGGGTLGVTSVSGFNSIGPILVENSTYSNTSSILSWLYGALRSAQVVQVTPGASINLVMPLENASRQSVGSRYSTSNSSLDPEGSALYVQASDGHSLNLAMNVSGSPGPGWLSLLVRALAESTMVVGYGSERQVVGWNTGDYNDSHQNWSWIRIFVNGTSRTLETPVPLELLNGSGWIAQLEFTPQSLSRSVLPQPLGTNLTFAKVVTSSYITNLTVSLPPNSSGAAEVTGSAELAPAPYGFPYAVIPFNESVPKGRGLAVAFNVTPGLLLSVNGNAFGGDSAGGYDAYSSSFYYDDLNRPYGNFSLTLSAEGTLAASSISAHFSVLIASANISSRLNVTDINSTIATSVSADTSGYRIVTSRPTPLLMVRMADYPGLTILANDASVTPSLGSLNILIWNAHAQVQFLVTFASAGTVLAGVVVAVVSTGVWVVAELLVRRLRGPRRSVLSNPNNDAASMANSDNPQRAVPAGDRSKD